MEWLVASLVLSVALTVVLNVLLRVFPHVLDRAADRLDDLTTSKPDDGSHESRVRVIVPWKAMIVVSVILTLAINVVLRVA